MKNSIQIAQQYLNEHIPITKHLGVTVTSFNGKSLVLTAPLAENINHRHSVFGGSLASVAILSGWTILHLNLIKQKIKSHLVIQKSNVDFLDPVLSNFSAHCVLPPSEKWHRFINMLTHKGKARIKLESSIFDNNEKKVGRHEGVYVAVIVQ